MTKFPKSGAFSKWEGLGEFAMFCFHALRGDFNDHAKRAEFTQRIVQEMWDNCDQDEVSGFMVCCNDWDASGYVGKTTLECCKLPFDVFCFPGDSEGWFYNKGDGGFINWAYIGNTTRDGKSVYFHKSPGFLRKQEEERKRREEQQKKDDEDWEHRDDWFHSGTDHKLPY